MTAASSPSLLSTGHVITNAQWTGAPVHIGMVFSIYDSTEEPIKKMIAANERTLNLGGGDGAALATATKRLRKLQISTLRGSPRDAKQFGWLIRRKEREKKEARYIEDTERLMAEIEMLKVVLYLVNRNNRDNT